MPSQENEKAMEGLLRRSLARDSVASGNCPDTELLAAYFDQSLGAGEAAGYDLHFSQCARCREQLAAMSRAAIEQNVEQTLEQTLDQTEAPAFGSVLVGARAAQPIALQREPVAEEAKAVSSADKLHKRQSPDSRRLDLRWLIPVAALLIFSTFMFTRLSSHKTNLGLGNQVAMSKPVAPPQEQAAPQPEKKATATGALYKNTPNNETSAANTPPNPQYSAKAAARSAPNSEVTRVVRNEGAAQRPGTTTRGASAATPKSSPGTAQGTAGRTSALQSQKQSGGAVAQYTSAPPEPAPAAPAPELNASMPAIVVTTDSADAVKSPAPAPPANAQQKSQSFELAGRNLNSSAAAKSLAKAKAAQESYTVTVISTPDSDIFYRTAGGGYVEISEDGGVNWQRQLLNPSAEFTAGSAPEPRICWLVGRSGIIFLTEDGKNWRKLPSPTSDDLVVVVAKSASTATVTANDNRKWTTDDAGENWRQAK